MLEEQIVLEIAGSSVALPRDVVRTLAAVAAARAALSSRHRELSLLLGRALDSGKATLGHNEERALRAVLEEAGLALP